MAGQQSLSLDYMRATNPFRDDRLTRLLDGLTRAGWKAAQRMNRILT